MDGWGQKALPENIQVLWKHKRPVLKNTQQLFDFIFFCQWKPDTFWGWLFLILLCIKTNCNISSTGAEQLVLQNPTETKKLPWVYLPWFPVYYKFSVLRRYQCSITTKTEHKINTVIFTAEKNPVAKFKSPLKIKYRTLAVGHHQFQEKADLITLITVFI